MKARRSNGDGAIDKVQRKRKDGTIVERWRGRVRLGIDRRTGKNRRVTFYADTRSELATKIANLKSDASRGIVPSSERMTVAQYMKRWLNEAVVPSKRPATAAQYEYIIGHIAPRIGHVRLDHLTPLDVQGLLHSFESDGKSAHFQGLVYVVLHAALKQAVRWDLVPRNAAQGVCRPRAVRHTMRVLTPEQADQLLAAAESSPLYALYVLALTTGMRRGELLGLQWDDVDLEAGALSVRRIVTVVRNRLIVGDTKTAASRRRIDLPTLAVSALRDHRKSLLARGLRGSQWVFPNSAGGPIAPHNLAARSFRPLLDAAGLPRVRFHDLRHTAATLMLLRGVQPKVVQERLGHASIAMTMDTYSHVLPSMQRAASDEIDALFGSLRAARTNRPSA
ncbi:MAG: tyrosine-type recombinase/integrase [Candidatus Tyrphobacter sp.]